MKEIHNVYYKTKHNGPMLISGRSLPDPKKGPYRFVGCDMHPAVWDVLKEEYSDSEFVNCDMGPIDRSPGTFANPLAL